MVHRRVAECFLKDLGLNKEAGHCAWVARRGCYPRLFSLPPHPRCPCSVARLCPTLGYRVDYSVQGFPVLHYLPEFSYSCPLSWWWHSTVSSSVTCFSSSPQSFPASGSSQMSQFFTSRWPKYWIFSFNISPSNEYSGLISFRMDWLDLLAVQLCNTTESSPTPQFKSINSLVLSLLYVLL